MKNKALLLILPVLLFLAAQAVAQTSNEPAPNSAEGLVKQAQKLNSEGKHDDALSVYNQALKTDPNNLDAHIGMGVVLDLKGEYAEARQHLQKAINVAPADAKPRALRVMGMSYAFESKASETAKYHQQVFDAQLANKNFEGAAGVANELGRVYLESGDLDNAYKWYQLGYETALRKTDLKDTDKSLWDFRWEHAQARIAVRRKQRAETEKHVAAAKVALDKADNKDQVSNFPYLTGYVAFYRGAYKTAITDLQQANLDDPFIQCLLAQAYERTGDKAKAAEHYRKVLESNSHSPATAFSRPLAMKKLKQG